jgi:uncharacterized protein (TIGR02001 family)
MMKQTLIATAAASACLLSAAPALAADAPASPWTFTGNIGVVSDYLFRGISQTNTEPAIQGGFDLTHSNGLYVGTWLSSISWVSDTLGGSYPTEVDFYGGYRASFASDFGYDLGVITYVYPGEGRLPGTFEPDTTEVYGALSWKWLSAKYSYVVSDYFVGWGTSTGGKTDGSDYIELNASFPLADGWGISVHWGDQTVEDNSPASYNDWNIGVTKDVGFGVIGLKYSSTDVNGTCTSTGGTSAYCWGNLATGTNREDVADDVAVLTFSKTF